MAVQPKRIVTPRISTSGSRGFPVRYIVILILLAAWGWVAYLIGRDGFGSGDPDSLESGKPKTEYEAIKQAGVVGKFDSSAKLQLHIKDISIVPADQNGSYQYRVTVEPLIGRSGVATGMLKLIISGENDGDDQVVEIPGAKNELENGRRPFTLSQDLVGDVALPKGFEPERVALELFTGEDTSSPLIQKYSWSDVLAEKKHKVSETSEDKEKVSELERENLALKIKLAKAEAAAMPAAETTVGISGGTVQQLKSERDAMAKEIVMLKQEVSDLTGKVEIKDIQVKTKMLSREVDFYIHVTRTIQDGNKLNGALYVILSGNEGDEYKVYTHEQITPDKLESFKLGFRNFQEIKQTLIVPKGFTPVKMIIHVVPENKNIKGIKKEYDWEKLTVN
jgi:hypothetical protein